MLLLTLPALGFTVPAHELCPEAGMSLPYQSQQDWGVMENHHDQHGHSMAGAHHQSQALVDSSLQQEPCPECSQCLLPAIVLTDRGLVPVVGSNEPLAQAPLLPATPNLDRIGPPPRQPS